MQLIHNYWFRASISREGSNANYQLPKIFTLEVKIKTDLLLKKTEELRSNEHDFEASIKD